MDIFGIGILEIVFVLLISIIILGPEGLVKTAKKLGRGLRSIINSTWWKDFQEGYHEVQNMSGRWLNELDIEETSKEDPHSPAMEHPANAFKTSSWKGHFPPRDQENPR